MQVYLYLAMYVLMIATLMFGTYVGFRSGRTGFALLCGALLAAMVLAYLLPLMLT